MIIKKLVVLASVLFMITSCSTDKYGNTFFGFNRSNAMTDKGTQYLLGRGVPKDNEKAFYYYSQAAEQGDPLAQNELAYLYAAGKGTSRNYEKAFFYYQLAAKSGLSSAQYSLGLMYLHGLGTARNKPMAQQWFEQSAKEGFEPAKVALARKVAA